MVPRMYSFCELSSLQFSSALFNLVANVLYILGISKEMLYLEDLKMHPQL